MFSPDGKFSLEGAEVAFHVLSTVDPRLQSAKINLEATFTNAFVDKAQAIIVQK
jgi:NitT/TauT family transport system substrate-binding protein